MKYKIILALALFGGLSSLPAIGKSLSISYDGFQYADEYTDSESHLQYLHARYYASSLMHFVSRDRYSDLQKALFDHTYNYAGGNPVGNKDPSGYCLWDFMLQPIQDARALINTPTPARMLNVASNYPLIPIDFQAEAETLSRRLAKQEKFTQLLKKMNGIKYADMSVLLRDIKPKMKLFDIKEITFNIDNEKGIIEFRIRALSEPTILHFKEVPMIGRQTLGYQVSIAEEFSRQDFYTDSDADTEVDTEIDEPDDDAVPISNNSKRRKTQDENEKDL